MHSSDVFFQPSTASSFRGASLSAVSVVSYGLFKHASLSHPTFPSPGCLSLHRPRMLVVSVLIIWQLSQIVVRVWGRQTQLEKTIGTTGPTMRYSRSSGRALSSRSFFLSPEDASEVFSNPYLGCPNSQLLYPQHIELECAPWGTQSLSE